MTDLKKRPRLGVERLEDLLMPAPTNIFTWNVAGGTWGDIGNSANWLKDGVATNETPTLESHVRIATNGALVRSTGVADLTWYSVEISGENTELKVNGNLTLVAGGAIEHDSGNSIKIKTDGFSTLASTLTISGENVQFLMYDSYHSIFVNNGATVEIQTGSVVYSDLYVNNFGNFTLESDARLEMWNEIDNNEFFNYSSGVLSLYEGTRYSGTGGVATGSNKLNHKIENTGTLRVMGGCASAILAGVLNRTSDAVFRLQEDATLQVMGHVNNATTAVYSHTSAVIRLDAGSALHIAAGHLVSSGANIWAYNGSSLVGDEVANGADWGGLTLSNGATLYLGGTGSNGNNYFSMPTDATLNLDNGSIIATINFNTETYDQMVMNGVVNVVDGQVGNFSVAQVGGVLQETFGVWMFYSANGSEAFTNVFIPFSADGSSWSNGDLLIWGVDTGGGGEG